jgi:polysaccharide biosynthesis protein PslJ
MAALAVGIAVISLARDRRLLALGLACAVALFVLAQGVPWTSAYVDHLIQGVRLEDRASQMRVGEYRDALRLIGRYPLLGVGFGSPRDVDLYRGVSNLYLIIAETVGVAGLTVFLATVGAVMVRLAAAWHACPSDDMRAVVLGCLAAIVTALASGLFDHYFFTYPHAFALLWLIAGMGMSTVGLETLHQS